MYFEFTNKTKICAGKGALDQLEFECLQHNMKHPLILTDDVLYKLNYIDILKKHLTLNYILFTHIPVDSSIHVVEEIKEFYIKEKCDGIIALGGGSVLDTAKGVFLMLSQECDSIDEILGFESLKKGVYIPFFAIPTTSGTGSEATCVAVVSNPEKKVKLEIISQSIQSDVAFLDPVFTENLPLKTTASTSIDTLVHAIEAYSCSAKNPLSDSYAITAMNLIYNNLLPVLDNSRNKDLRMNLALASYLAGASFSNSMVGIVHAIGHALGAVCHIAHGDAMSMLLIPCMKYNLNVNKELYSDLLLYLGEKELYASTPKEELANKSIEVISNLLTDLNKKVDLPISLESVQNLKENIEEVANKALNDGALIVNNKYASYEDILDILGGKYGY